MVLRALQSLGRYAAVGAALALNATAAQAITQDKKTDLSASKLMHDSDYFGPIGISGETALPKGKWAFAYKVMSTDLQDIKDSGSEVSIGDIVNLTGNGRYHYPSAPTKMVVNSHIFEGQYAPSRQFTLVATLPIHRKTADFMTAAGGRFAVESEGVGDVVVKGVAPLTGDQADRWMGTVGFSLPTGKTNMRGKSPFTGDQMVRLPYALQNGSGSVDMLLGLAYRRQLKDGSWGAKADFTFRSGANSNGYRLGHVGELSVWNSYRVAQKWNTSLRLSGKQWDAIEGRDLLMSKGFGPMSDPAAQGGRRVDLSFGINLQEPNNLKGQRFALEASLPVLQELNGPQLETKRYFTFGFGKDW